MAAADGTAPSVPVSAIVPAFEQVEKLRETLHHLLQCDPVPEEIIVHVDGASAAVTEMLRQEFPGVRLLTSSQRLGPGGSRNVLVAAARNAWVANFDDDSYPDHPDYFAHIMDLTRQFPEAAILTAGNHGDPVLPIRFTREPMASGCGCVFRKDWFERCGGFVPLPIAYNMEEVDMGLRICALGGIIVRDDQLRIFHDKPPPVRVPASVNAAILANTALLPFLRFPVWLWPVGVLQVANRIRYLIGRGWTAGIGEGLRMIPGHLRRYAAWRRVQPTIAILSWLRLKRSPQPLVASEQPRTPRG
jgi:GT2 family glycosyltransferase